MFETLLAFRPFGVDFFCFGKKFLVFNLVSKNLKVKYQRSVLGVAWTLLAPIGMGAVYYLVFDKILKIQIPHYLAFIVSGIFSWTFFSQTVSEGMESLVASWGLISKIPIPLQVFPFVGATTNLVTLSFSIPVMLAAAWLSDVRLGPSLVMLPVYFGLLYFLAYSFSLIFAIAYVFFRDLKHLISILMQIWFYATPILYDDAMIPEKYHWIVYANPVAMVFKGLHAILTQGEWPHHRNLAVLCVWTLVMMMVAALIQRKLGEGLVEKI